MIKFLAKNQIIKRIIVTILLTMEMLTIFAFDSNIDVYADSNSLRKTYLELASNRNETEMSVDSMSMDDLKMLALYLSNFYIPFGTALDDAEDNYYHDNCVAQLIKLGYTKEMAENLVDYIYDMNLSSCQPLYMSAGDWQNSRTQFYKNDEYRHRMGFGDDFWDPGMDTSNFTEAYKDYMGVSASDDIGTYFPLTLFGYYMTLDFFAEVDSEQTYEIGDYLGNKKKIFADESATDEDDILSSDFIDKWNEKFPEINLPSDATYADLKWNLVFLHPQRGVLCDDDGNLTFTLISNCYKRGSGKYYIGDYLSSDGVQSGDVIRFYYKNSSGDLVHCFTFDHSTSRTIGNLYHGFDDSNGYMGNALYNMSGFSANGGSVANASDSDLFASIFFFQKMYVDWVGNIICDFGDKRVIVVPACYNPYVFCNIDDDPANLSPYFNLASTFAIHQANDTSNSSPWYIQSNGGWYGYNYRSHTIDLKMSRGSRDSADWNIGESGALWWKSYGNGRVLKDVIKPMLNSGTDDSFDGTGMGVHEGLPIIYDKRDSYKNWTYEIVWYNKETNDVLQANDFNAISLIDVCASDSYPNYFTDTSSFSDMKHSGFSNFVTTDSSSQRILKCIYLTYAFAYANKDGVPMLDDGFPADCVINWKFRDIFPQVSGRINFERLNSVAPNAMAEQTLSMVYYLLHPSKGINYVATLFKRKIGGILLGWHDDIVGATSSNYTTGGTNYLGFSGYVTTPRIQEISWINVLVENYDSIIIYLIMIMSIILLAYVLLGQLSVQRGIIGLIMFALLAFLPPVAINATVDIINSTCDSIYNSKFDFWAITQTENIVMNFENYANASTKEDSFISYLNESTIESAGQAGNDTESSFCGVQIKWMTPKRSNDAAAAIKTAERTSLAGSNLNLKLIVSQALADDSQHFVAGATYLYRDYTDIYKHTVYAYNISNENAYKRLMNPDTSNKVELKTKFFAATTACMSPGAYKCNVDTLNVNDYWASSNLNSITLYDGTNITNCLSLSNTDARSHGYAVNHGFLYNNNANFSAYNKHNEALLLPLNHNSMYYNIHLQRVAFDKTLDGTTKIKMGLDYLDNMGEGNFGADPTWFNFNTFELAGTDSSVGERQQNYQNLSTLYYMLYSESPFYYFDFNVRDQYSIYKGSNTFNPHEASKCDNFYRLWLYDEQTYFYNRHAEAGDGYNELRDFMNFHDFFYYIVPLFNDGNTLVDEFDKTFGMFTYEDCSFRIDEAGRFWYGGVEGSDTGFDTLGDMITYAKTLGLSNEEQYKLWHDVNVWCLFYCYTTWLDTMQDCDYALPQDINIMGEKFRVERPLDPTSYYIADSSGNIVSGRYMVFSRSEMKYYGLDWSDLTTVEQKIITVQDRVYSETLNLTNYLSMSDENLITAYSMIQLFEFNKEFSQSSFLGDSYLLYPQGYELKAFSYDAYMRLILSGSTGDDLVSSPTTANYVGTEVNQSIYERIMNKTSIFFGISLIINDFLAVYCIPAFKLFFLIAVFLTSIAIIVSSAIKLELNMINVVWKSLFAPLLSFIAISIGLGWLVSMFMSNGIQNIHKRGVVISLGDPTMTVLVMIVINVAALVLYFKLCKKQLQDLVKYAKAVGTSVGGVVTGLGHAAVGAFSANKLSQIARNTSGVAGNAKQRGKDNNPTSGKTGSTVGGIAAGAGAGALAGAVAGAGTGNTPDTLKAGENKYDVKSADSRINSNTQKKLDEEAKLAAARSKTFNGKNEANAKKAGDLANQAKDDWAVANNKNVNLGDRMRAGRSAIANGLKSKGYGAKAAVGAKVAKGLGMDKRVSRAELESKSRIDALNSAIKDDKVRRNIGANRDRINSNMNNADKKAKLDAYKHAKARGMNAQSAARYAKKGATKVDRKVVDRAVDRHNRRASAARSGRANIVKFKKRA